MAIATTKKESKKGTKAFKVSFDGNIIDAQTSLMIEPQAVLDIITGINFFRISNPRNEGESTNREISVEECTVDFKCKPNKQQSSTKVSSDSNTRSHGHIEFKVVLDGELLGASRGEEMDANMILLQLTGNGYSYTNKRDITVESF